ncbi:Glycosidase [Thermoanaerobacter thermohydrosulfuricus WC1]|uniref:Glycosidase n=1 Tax=Thermoanaerobacter thermohydrosulfuricus WC1 TaxID=1198630 RepID=M8DFA6_THETY|nr:glycoside hydrolase family 13 protein [Thermoanaerobacter thermohydrosulfuricus]EMT38717.1 Glycosidase [Thermoanaerobacter thermohydrosulfuricus WC1]
MIKEAIFHKSDIPFAYPLNENQLKIVLRTAVFDVDRVYVLYKDRYDWLGKFKIKPMVLTHTNELFDYYETTLELNKKFVYFFYLVAEGGEKLYYTEAGFYKKRPENQFWGFFHYPYIGEKDVFFAPEWTSDCMVYQIFPERFNNGDKSNDPENVKPWGEKPTADSFFGGDLQGIIDKIDYLKDLGINAIYLTPIFLSHSTHKYDTTDYYTIDPHFGDTQKARELVQKCHDNGIKVIFDAVFNHCGYDFFAFQDVIKNGKKSKYWDWFNIYEWPIKTHPKPSYEAFADTVWRMPKLMTKNPEVQKYLLEVAEYWIKEVDIDGWRLDVANEIDHHFWRKFREVVKAAKPEAIIVGEVWHDASPWLRGDQFDSVMNYPFRNAVVDFFAKRKISASRFNTMITEQLMRHMDSVNRVMFNLTGSHDTERFLTLANGMVARMKLALVFQFTFVGIPYIYYGDEVGMVGDYDPDCRRCMIWEEEKQNKSIFNFYKKLISIRRENEELKYGSFCTLYAIGRVFAFKREYKGKSIIVVLNNSSKQEVIFLNEAEGKEDILKMKELKRSRNLLYLQPNSAYILK